MKTIFTLFLCLIGLNVAMAQSANNNGYQIGDVASDFNLLSVTGDSVSLSSFDDANGYIVVFTCNHCPYAIMYEDRLNALHAKYEPQGFPVVAINPNDPAVKPIDSYDNMIARADEKNFQFHYLFDDGQEVFPIYGATKTPHVYLLDDNKVVRYIGAIDDNPRNADDVSERYVENAIEAIKAGNDPNPLTTKAIGCSIKVLK